MNSVQSSHRTNRYIPREYVEENMTNCARGSHKNESNSEDIRSGKLKLLWICVIIGAFIGTAWHLHRIFKTYFDYGYYESIINKKSNLEFPDITICSSPSDHQVSKNPAKFSNIMVSGFTMIQYILTNNIAFNPDIVASPDLSYANLSPEERKKFGAEVSEIILNCTFHGRPCADLGNFVLFLHHILYNCYTFKYNTKKTVSTGPYNGLSLMLRGTNPLVAIYDKMQPVGNTEALKIIIHARDTVPFVMHKGISIQPGKSTDIGIAMKKYTRLDEPYDKCARKEWVTDMYDNRYKMNEKLCEQTAKFSEILQTCSCYAVRFFPHKYKQYQDHHKNCLYVNRANFSESLSRMKCQNNMFQKFDLGTPNNCSWPCQETDYDITMSQANWPQDIMISDFIGKYILTLPDTSPTKMYYYKIKHEYHPEQRPNSILENRETKAYSIDEMNDAVRNMVKNKNASLDFLANATFETQLYPYLLNKTFDEALEKWIGKSFYRVNIFFQKSTIEYHTQVVRYTSADLFAAAGGVCGLWVGISCISTIDASFKGIHFLWKLLQIKKEQNST